MTVEAMPQPALEQRDNVYPGVTSEELATIKRVFANFPAIQEVILFGSRIKGTHKESSSQIRDMKFWIQELLDREITYPMHVKERSEVTNMILLQAIMNEGVRL